MSVKALVVVGVVDAAAVGRFFAGGVMGVAAIATWIPARRAATVDPLVALRGE